MDPLELHKDAEVVKNDITELTEESNQSDVLTSEPVAEEQLSETLAENIEVETSIDKLPEQEIVIEASTTELTDIPAVSEKELSRNDLIDKLKLLLSGNVESVKEEVEQIKLLFYKRLKAEHDEAKKFFIEAGGEEAEFNPEKDGLEDELKSLLNEYKTLRSALTAQKESEREQNLLEKQHILDRMKVLVESNDDVSTHVNEFRELQKKWKTIGQVPQSQVNALWKSYTAYQEAFWDLIKINNELREYDFKKNLEAKTLICEAAEKLDSETDVISAFHQLQKLHEEWHETGPVARELRDEIWARFKSASSVINRKHQGYFDEIRKLEDENLVLKTAICEKLETFDFSTFNSYKSWDEATKTVISWQEEWRSIGFAPRKMNHKIYDRYRAACDAFFNAKAEFYKESKSVLSTNLDKKKALCEKAESLKDSQDWKETTDKLIQLQKEWKTVGPVAKKYSDDLWKRFISACDYFFDQKQKNTSDQRSSETDNLIKKKELIAQVQLLDTVTDKSSTEILASLRDYIAQWNEIGHVPFKEKDKIYKEYRSAVDQMFEKLNIDANQRRLDNFKSNLRDMSTKGDNKLHREREKLMRAYEHLKSEISTYENNIGFLTTNNKKGSPIIREMERKIESLKEEAKLLEQKIILIEESI